MSSIDLFILGFFITPRLPGHPETELPQAWSPYELASFIEKNDLQELIKISTPALYKNIAALKKNGFLEDSNKINGGNADNARRLTVTEQGIRRFRELIKEAASASLHYRLEMNALIVNLDKLPTAEALGIMKRMETAIEEKAAYLAACAERFWNIPLPGRALIRQNIMLNEAMLAWIRDFTREYVEECEKRKGSPV